MDSNTSAVVEMSWSPPIHQLSASNYMIPVYGTTRFGTSEPMKYGLYFTYYDKSSCKFQTQDYILSFDSTNISDFHKGEFIKYANVKNIISVDDFSNSLILFSPFASSYSIGDISYFNDDRIIYNLSIQSEGYGLKWYKRNKDFNNNFNNRNVPAFIEAIAKNSVFASEENPNILVATRFQKVDKKQDFFAGLYLLDAKSGNIINYTKFSTQTNININHIRVLQDSTILLLGSRYDITTNEDDERTTQKKLYFAKFNSKLEFLSEYVYDPQDSSDNCAFSDCIELGEGKIFIMGHNKGNLLGVLFKNSTSFIESSFSNNSQFKISAKLNHLSLLATLSGEENSETEIEVYNVAGNCIHSGKYNINAGVPLDIYNDALINGVYLIKITNHNFSMTHKIVIE